METVVLVIHLMVAFALVMVVLLQRSEGGALGMGGSGSSAITTARGASNILTRTTAILATCFMITSLVLAIIAGRNSDSESLLEKATVTTESSQNTVAEKDVADKKKETGKKSVSDKPAKSTSIPDVPVKK